MDYVAYNPQRGVYLGQAMGNHIWTRVDPVQGIPAAATFSSPENMSGLFFLEDESRPWIEDSQLVAVECDIGRYHASEQACIDAGLPAWNTKCCPE